MNITSIVQLLIVNIYLFYNTNVSLDESQNSTNSIKNANIADCLKNPSGNHKENKLSDGTIDVIFDNPYLTE